MPTRICLCLSEIVNALKIILCIEAFTFQDLAASPISVMEISKPRLFFSNSLVFSSLFLSVICFAGLIRVEIELHVHRQMLQVLNQPREVKLEQRNTANEEDESGMKMLYSDSDKGWFAMINKTVKASRNPLKKERRIKKLGREQRKLKHDS